ILEEDETNNSCSNSVVVKTADLTVAKTNDVGGTTNFPTGWTWTLKVSNPGDGAAVFNSGDVILQDDLPLGVTYGSFSVGSFNQITNSANIACTLATTSISSTVSCKAGGGSVTIASGGGSFTVSFTATPKNRGTFANPTAGGVCAVDPNNVLSESDETNNS